MKNLLIITFLLLLSVTTGFADNIRPTRVDGICYSVNDDQMTARVIEAIHFNGEKIEYTGNIVIPDYIMPYSPEGKYKVIEIAPEAFLGCNKLNSITLGAYITSIGKGYFEGCSNLTSVSINSQDIFNSMWSSNFSLAEVFGSQVKGYIIGGGVTYITNNTFSGCSSLTTIQVAANNPNYDSRGNCNAIIETKSNTLIVGCTNTIIPNNVATIGEYAFDGSSGMTCITIPGSVTSVGERAFYNCSGLTSIYIHENVRAIGECAFQNCSSLEKIVVASGNLNYDSRNNCNAIIETSTNTLIAGCKNTIIPEGVTSIGKWVFCLCDGLTSVTIPESVTSIGEFAFECCSNLKDVYCSATNPPVAQHYIKFDMYYSGYADSFDSQTIGQATLHVPASAINAYKTTEPWSKFGTIVALSNTDTEVEINETNFPDENFRNWLLEQEYGTDGVLTEDEIAEVVTIEVNEKGIHSLKGIEYFTELIAIGCQNNQLTALDLSNNKALTWLNCSSNKLTTLDLSKNTKLTYLRCYQNQIKGAAMDILVESMPTILSYNTWYDGKMYAIYDENEQNEMTFTQVAVIKEKGWIPYACYDNEWEEYDGNDAPVIRGAINATNFPDKNFRNWLLEQEYGKDSFLTDEEIDGVTEMELYYMNIQSLKGIEYFTSLTSLGCDGNQLTELDLSMNNKLTILNCSDNQLTSLNVAGCTELIRILCYNNQLTELNVSGCTALNVLSCFQNQIKDEAMNALIESLPTVNEGSLLAIYNENEQNVMTALQVEKAKAKGWTVYAYTGIDDWGKMYWEEYAGSDPDGIKSLTPAFSKGEGDWYDLNGRKLAAPQKGINIIRHSDGTSRKVLVK